MRSFPRHIALLLLLLLIPSALQAQDEIIIVGSGIVEPALQALIDASESEANFTLTVTGTSTGFDQFCANQADITTATRPINAEEQTACNDNQVTPLELTLGHNVLAFIGNPADTALSVCLTGAELNSIYAPSSEGEITNWNQVLTDGPDLALTTIAPGDSTPDFTVLDNLIEGDGIRGDAVIASTSDEIITQVSGTPGAVGVVSLPQAQAAGDAVRILELDAGAVQGCQAASATSVEDGLYPAAEPLYAYVNIANLTKAQLAEFLTYAVSAEATAAIESTGFVPATEVAAQSNRDNLSTAQTGEFTAQTNTGFVIPAGLTGQVNIGGAGDGFELLNASVTAFNATTPDVTVNLNLEGLIAGARRLCNGEVDALYSYRDLTAEEAGNCAANNITLVTLDVGTPAVVLVGNAASDYLTCLTTETLTTIWQAQPGEAITNWNQAGGPDEAMTLFSPLEGSPYADLLMLAASGSSLATRVDIQLDDDALYRAAATANVPGALAFMSWQEYQRVLANNQANIQLVAVDAGEGCITPDATTIESGQYPLVRPGKLVINQSQFTRIEVQSLFWFMFSTDNFSSFEQSSYVGIRLTDLEAARNTLLAAFDAAARAVAEGTPEATSEATEAVEEATVEPTEAVEEPAESVTEEAEATIEATTAPTEVATEAVEEVTEEATSEATAEATEEA
jgi:phosphate transport system substrate-binding protein